MKPHVRIGCIESLGDSSAVSCVQSMYRYRQNPFHNNCIRRAVCFQFYAYISGESVIRNERRLMDRNEQVQRLVFTVKAVRARNVLPH